MDHEKIFGPFSTRQITYIVVGIFVAHFARALLGPVPWALFTAAVAGTVLSLVRGAKEPPFDEKFLRDQHARLGREKFAGWARQKIALLRSHAVTRAERGLPADPKLAEAERMIEAALR